MTGRLLVGMLGLLPTMAQAQVNVEPLADYTQAPGWGFDAQGRFSLTSGNVQLTNLSADGAVHWAREFDDDKKPRGRGTWFRDRLILFGNYGLTTVGRGDDASVILDTKLVHLRYTRMVVPQFGFEAYGQIGNDVVLLLDWRALLGGGIRLVATERDAFRLWGGTGYLYEREDRAEGVVPEDVVNHRSSTYVSFEVTLLAGDHDADDNDAFDRLDLLSTTYVQPRWDDFSDVQVLEEAKLRVGLTKTLALGVELRVRVDTRPPETLVPADLRFTNTLEVHL